MLRVGLTGGIASGKSSVAELFVELGAALVDTDVVAREVVAPGEPGLTAVREAFGDGILTASGKLDRAKLRKIVFDDEPSRRRLEALLHPLIRRRTVVLLDETTGPYVIVAVPLLVETDFAELVNRVLVVDCSQRTQVQRLMERDAMSEREAAAAVAAQADRAARLEAADDVIDNDGTRAALRGQVEALHRRYLALAEHCRAQPGHAE